MQNTIFKAFEHEPRVVTALVSQVDSASNIQTFWSNYYLRGQVLFDPTAYVGGTLYQQPYGGVPFSRGWIIDADQNVVLPLFGYDPDRIIQTIEDLLVDMPLGDINRDGVVDVSDLTAVILAWGECPPLTACPADVDADGFVSVSDLVLVLLNWS